MENLKTFAFIVFLLGFQALGAIGQELVIEREANPANKAKTADWKKVKGTEFFLATFVVPPDFVAIGALDADEDPFGESGRKGSRIEPKEILEAHGVAFPEGTMVAYLATRSEIVVRNTRENLELVQEIVDDMIGDEPFQRLVIRAEIYELTTLQVLQLQESAETKSNHKPERNAALKLVREGGAKLVATPSLVVQPGQRALADGMTELAMLKSSEEAAKKIAEHKFGTRLEVEPNIDADGETITLNIALEHHTAKPEFISVAGKEDQPLFHKKSIQTNTMLRSGQHVLLASWKPSGKPEYDDGNLTQVVFVTASVQLVE